MLTLHTTLLYLHILLGAIALVIYWLPIFARKGSPLHVNIGRLFYAIMLVIAFSGVTLCLIGLFDPKAVFTAGRSLTEVEITRLLAWRIPFTQFLLLLSVLTWVTVRHAIGVLKAKTERQQLRQLSYQGPVFLLFPLALYVAYQGIRLGMPLLTIFSCVSLGTAISICRYVYKKTIRPREWIIEHFTSMIGSGIAVYTAFFAAGGRRMLSTLLPNDWQMLTWLAAPMIGVTALVTLKGYYQRKYRVQ